MSKLSFRARQLDAYKAMPVYRSEEIPEVTDVAAINRAVPQMPTGMEKEEETEHHLQRALSAQQVYGTSEALVIPVPEIDDAKKQYEQIYPTDYKPPRQYIHAQSLGVDQEIPDYDIDSEDEAWLENQSKKIEITPKIFEEMIDRLEKGSGQQVVELKDAKVLLKEDDDLIITVYDYWLNKRLKYTPHPLIPLVKCEKRDGSTTNNPYVAFRRRTEKMQTRKNRKNDEASYEKMLKLRRDLQRAVSVFEMIKKREKCKKELLQLTIEVLDKRHEMEDYNGAHLAHAEAQKMSRSVFLPLCHDQYSKESADNASRRLKRKYEKKKHKSSTVQCHGDVDVTEYGSTEDEPLSPGISPSDQEDEAHPDGIYAFRRKKLCSYHAPLDSCGNWPWHSQQNGGHADKKYRYSLTSIDTGPESRRCIGYARRRRGRGGRILIDRAFAEQRADFWDRVLGAPIPRHTVSAKRVQHRLADRNGTISPLAEHHTTSGAEPTFQDYISEHKWLHFEPTDDPDGRNALFGGALLDASLDYDINDVSDPIIDVIPDPLTPTGSLVHSSTPTLTPLPNTASDSISSLLPNAAQICDQQTLLSSSRVSETSEHLTPTPSITTVPVSAPSNSRSTALEYEYESHHRQLQALKKDQHVSNSSSNLPNSYLECNNVDSNTSLASRVTTTNSMHNSSSDGSCNHLIESAKATYAVSALLVNGQSAGRGNGIKHLNGPSKAELRHAELNSTGGLTVKLNYPLTPSSDTNDTSISVESGEKNRARPILTTDIDSAGLNAIPDVASTMEVS